MMPIHENKYPGLFPIVENSLLKMKAERSRQAEQLLVEAKKCTDEALQADLDRQKMARLAKTAEDIYTSKLEIALEAVSKAKEANLLVEAEERRFKKLKHQGDSSEKISVTGTSEIAPPIIPSKSRLILGNEDAIQGRPQGLKQRSPLRENNNVSFDSIKMIKNDDWILRKSKTQNRYYYVNIKTREAFWSKPTTGTESIRDANNNQNIEPSSIQEPFHTKSVGGLEENDVHNKSWICEYSRSKKRYFYHDPRSGAAFWSEKPLKAFLQSLGDGKV